MNFKTTVKEMLLILATLAGCVVVMWLISAICGCSREAKDNTVSLQDLERKAGKYYKLLQGNEESVIDARCDGLTWRSLGHYAQINYPIFDMEYNPGEWHRDYKPCYPDDSRSEISRDGLIMLLVALVDRKDLDSVRRLQEYGSHHAWVMGEGPKQIVSGLPLRPIISEILSQKLVAESSDAILKADTFRGNLLAWYIWIRIMLNGKANEIEWQTIKYLYEANDQNPTYSTLYYKLSGEGDQRHTIDLLGNTEVFPEDQLPGRVEQFNWGDAPGSILYLATLKMLKHKHEKQ